MMRPVHTVTLSTARKAKSQAWEWLTDGLTVNVQVRHGEGPDYGKDGRGYRVNAYSHG